MAANEVHKDDVGTQFIVTVQDGSTVVDLSSTTLKQILFKKPSAATLTKTAVFVTDGVDGKISYTSISNDLNETGTWFLQVRLDFGSSTFRSDQKQFKVHENIA